MNDHERIQALERENAILKAAIRACPAGIMVCDANGELRLWNQAAEALGLTEKRPPVGVLPPSWQLFDAGGAPCGPDSFPLSRALRGESLDGELYRTHHPRRGDKWMALHAAPVRHEGELIAGVAIFRDVTTTKQMEAAAAQLDVAAAEVEVAAERFHIMAEHSLDFIGMARPNGKVEYVNKGGLALCGHPPTKDVEDMVLSDFHPPETLKPMIEDGFATAAREGHWRGENELLHADGSRIPVSQLISAHLAPSGEPYFFSTVMRDLRPIRELQSQLSQSQRLESIGRLAGGVAHDFNNLLTIIVNYSMMVAESFPDGDRRAEDLSQVVLASDRAADLCRQLLSFARRQIIKPTAVDLGGVVEELSKLLLRTLGEDIELNTDIGKDLWTIRADRSQLDQILMNLVVNARDAMAGGGELTIEVQNVVLDEVYAESHPEVDPGQYVMLAVTDTGAGIPEYVRDRVFEPFFTTKNAKGNGLGLATVHGAVRQNGGHIWLYSEIGQGTCFKIYWPRAGAQFDSQEVPVYAPLAVSNATIMVVEDEAPLRLLTTRLLRERGYDVIEAENGTHALELAQKEGPIHLLLTDVIMPQMNGPQLAEQLRAGRPEMQVLYVSGYTENTIVHRGMLERGVHFLAKPFSRASLFERIETLLRQAT